MLTNVAIFIWYWIKCSVSAQSCLRAARGMETPFRKLNGRARLVSRTQAIITSYMFECCGNITAWQTYVKPGGRRHQRVYDIYFQVWRPSPTVQENGCYSMVGENRYTSISLQRGGKVSETPEPSNILSVQPGDVVGCYTFSRRGTNDGILLDVRRSFDSVWYHTGTVNNNRQPDCPLPVGTETDRSLAFSTNAAPVLSVDVCKWSSTLTIKNLSVQCYGFFLICSYLLMSAHSKYFTILLLFTTSNDCHNHFNSFTT